MIYLQVYLLISALAFLYLFFAFKFFQEFDSYEGRFILSIVCSIIWPSALVLTVFYKYLVYRGFIED